MACQLTEMSGVRLENARLTHCQNRRPQLVINTRQSQIVRNGTLLRGSSKRYGACQPVRKIRCSSARQKKIRRLVARPKVHVSRVTRQNAGLGGVECEESLAVLAYSMILAGAPCHPFCPDSCSSPSSPIKACTSPSLASVAAWSSVVAGCSSGSHPSHWASTSA